MSSPLARDIAWLNDRLDEVESDSARADLGLIRSAARRMLDTARIDPELTTPDADRIHAALKFLTIRFHLRNKAEQVHIVRVNRRRERDSTPEHPRPESLAEAVRDLSTAGLSVERVQEVLTSLDITPTLTAHPTEARRRSVVEKQARIADMLEIHDQADATPGELDQSASDVRQTLSLLLGTDEIRSRRLDVIDEVRNGMHYLAGTIWNAVPQLYRDLERALDEVYGSRPDLPVFLRYRSWIGGDRDGNPNVTAALTRRAFGEMRGAAVTGHAAALEQLRRQLSLSDRRVPIDPALLESIERDEEERPLDADQVRHLRHEPFRVKIRHMQSRLGTPGYDADRFVADLSVLRDAVRRAGLEEVATRGLVNDLLIRARTFGFHLAALDVRQHSGVHETAVAELLQQAGVEESYADLDEPARRRLLGAELRTSRPLLARGAAVTPVTRELLDTLAVLAEQAEKEPAAVGSYIVSMAHDVSDVLEVLVLLREAGLWSIDQGVVRCIVDVAPLFETVDDLDRSDAVIRALADEPAYAAHLVARGSVQEIMLGYSDSNKDGGYWAANWRLHCAQDRLARTCGELGLEVRFFHGRGGTVARGGGRANRAILASPAASRSGRIRFTEQGEVISFRYAMPALARRHLEQIVNAMLLASAVPAEAEPGPAPTPALLDAVARRSRETYRALVDDPGFWPWFTERSPVLHIGALPIASRPSARAGGEMRFENIRAIPWVFAWTQMRYNAPGWYGIGTAFEELVLHDDDALEACREAYRQGGHVRAFIDNAQQEMARARLPVAAWYGGADSPFHQRLAEEFERSERAVLAVTRQTALLDNNPVIQASIRERNPDTDAINATQVELLRRWREADEGARPAIRTLILLSVNALAAAMQSTG